MVGQNSLLADLSDENVVILLVQEVDGDDVLSSNFKNPNFARGNRTTCAAAGPGEKERSTHKEAVESKTDTTVSFTQLHSMYKKLPAETKLSNADFFF